MRLFSTILWGLAFVGTLTLLPLALAYVADRFMPYSIQPRLWAVFGWVCAWPMEGAYRVTAWADTHAQMRGWFRLARWCGAAGERICPDQFHLTAIVLGHICWPCNEAVEGWWDYDVDCGGHRCRECDECKHLLRVGDFGTCA